MTTLVSRARWPFLDLMRATAALMVMAGHARGYFLPEFGAVASPTPLTKVLYVLTGLQHEGVVLFFLVSGFLVGGSVWEAHAGGHFNAVRYFGDRFVRIYLVFVPGVLLALAIHALGSTWLPSTRGFAGLPPETATTATVLCHVACLQGIYCSVIVVDAPLWSLSYEWVLYMAAPLLFGVLYSSSTRAWRATGLVLLAATAASVLPGHMQWWWVVLWLMGAVARRVATWRPVGGGVGATGLAVAVLGLLLSRLRVLPTTGTDFVIASGFAVTLASRNILALDFAPRLVRRLADCSYSLYVIHLPVILLTVALLECALGRPAPVVSAGNVLLFCLTAIVALGAALLFARATEHHTQLLQRALRSGLGASEAAAIAAVPAAVAAPSLTTLRSSLEQEA